MRHDVLISAIFARCAFAARAVFICATDAAPAMPAEVGGVERAEAGATNLVATLRRAGYDMIRLDAIPAASSVMSAVTKDPSGESETWHAFLAECAERKFGVWAELREAATAKPPTPADVSVIDDPASADEWAEAVASASDPRALFAAAPFDPRLEMIVIRNLRDWGRSFNPRTGRRYADDPVFKYWTYTPDDGADLSALPEFFRKQTERARVRWTQRRSETADTLPFPADAYAAHAHRVLSKFALFGAATRDAAEVAPDVVAPSPHDHLNIFQARRIAGENNTSSGRLGDPSPPVVFTIPWRGAAEDSFFASRVLNGSDVLFHTGVITNNPATLDFPDNGFSFRDMRFGSIGRDTNKFVNVKFAVTGEVVRIALTISAEMSKPADSFVIAFHALDLDDGERVGMDFAINATDNNHGALKSYVAYNRMLNVIAVNEYDRFRPRPPSDGVFMYELRFEKKPFSDLPWRRK